MPGSPLTSPFPPARLLPIALAAAAVLAAPPLPAAEPAAEPRITDLFNFPVSGRYPYGREDYRFLVKDPAILESGSMVAVALSVQRSNNGSTGKYWSSVVFMDRDGDAAPTTRTLNPIQPARFGSIAYKSRVFLNAGLSYLVVDRDPSVPVKGFDVGGGWMLGAVTDDYVILHTRDAYSYGTDLRFLDADTLQQVGTVTAKIRTARVAAGENEIFLASESGGKLKLHRMAYPDFSQGPVVKGKISGVPGTYSWLEHFSPDHAVMTDLQGQEIIVRWNDPANGGKPGLYRPPADQRHVWFETGGRLGVIGTYPELSISHVRLGNGSYTFEPAGVPEGFRDSQIHSIGPDSVFLTPPTRALIYGSASGWCSRVRLDPGRQLRVEAPVAEERDGEMRFRVSLDRPSATPVRFDYQTIGRSAVAGEDFTPISGTATLAPGETGLTLAVPLLEDQTIERPETLEFQITGLSGAFTDHLRTPGRIRGSGMRVLEEVETDDGSVLPTLDGSLTRTTGVPVLNFPGGPVTARDHGFEYFIPLAQNSGTYFYARGHRLGSDAIVLCQFDPARGELTEVFESENARKPVGDQFLLRRGDGYVRYGFFDGLPVLSLDGLEAREGGGAQTFTVRSERTRASLDLFAAWTDPAGDPGPVSFRQLDTGDIALDLAPPDDGAGTYDLRRGITATVAASGSPAPGSMRTALTISDARAIRTSRVATTARNIDGLAAAGNRLWLGERGKPLLEGLKFENGSLLPAATASLPSGANLDWLGYHGSGFSGQGLAFDGTRILTGFRYDYQNRGTASAAGASSAKTTLKLFKSAGQGGSHLVGPGFLAMGVSDPTLANDGIVQILDSRNNKKLRTLNAPLPEPSFGYSLAFTGNTLWISAPRPGGGKVYGFSVPGFTLTTTLASPDPVPNGTFGYSLAGSAEHLVIGEPSTRAPGAAWVYSSGGGTLLKRLRSGVTGGSDGFGARVAARAGRLMVGSARISWELNSLTSVPQDWPVNPTPEIPDGTHHPVLLWMDLAGPAIPLKAAASGRPDHSSGGAIALLDDCAVFTSRGPQGGALEFHPFFPAAPAGD